MQSLTDQVAVITGAGQGIGRAVAQVLAAEGARVAIADVEADRAEATAADLRAAGHGATAYAVDVVDLASVTAMTDAVVAEWGRIDILAANRGHLPVQPDRRAAGCRVGPRHGHQRQGRAVRHAGLPAVDARPRLRPGRADVVDHRPRHGAVRGSRTTAPRRPPCSA